MATSPHGSIDLVDDWPVALETLGPADLLCWHALSWRSLRAQLGPGRSKNRRLVVGQIPELYHPFDPPLPGKYGRECEDDISLTNARKTDVAGMDGIDQSELPALFRKLYDLPPSEVRNNSQFRALLRSQHDRSNLLSCIPVTCQPSARPIHLLHALLTEFPGSWPASALVSAYSRLYKSLAESDKRQPDGRELGSLADKTGTMVKASYTSLLDFIEASARPALRGGGHNSDQVITYQGLHDLTNKLCLPEPEDSRVKPVVAIALPNGPLLAAVCVAVTTWYTAAPINPTAGAKQFRDDVRQAGARYILTTWTDYRKLELDDCWISNAAIGVFCVEWDGRDGFDFTTADGGQVLETTNGPSHRTLNQPDDMALVLFTSGTSGAKKVVPLMLHSIVAGVVSVVDSWGLGSEDVCLNMMPLYHV
ncbi:hypothetical protein XA68_16204 [Ophiocordyceps unilateralis]|uniref:AMP-dependent synthetase/ligase domain-containing protein n=1 Tax=Ophiocordyceps unilateralis TaxID=268505 RepID=A0A2A9P711_OPHUN|nr:hypothetical protein XA68_16204 [Ophiocordyceps unilateralis]